MSYKFFSFSGLRKFLKQDLNALKLQRYKNGYRQTIQCKECKSFIKSKNLHFTDVCACGKLSIEENSYFYKIVGDYEERDVKSVLYTQFREIKL